MIIVQRNSTQPRRRGEGKKKMKLTLDDIYDLVNRAKSAEAARDVFKERYKDELEKNGKLKAALEEADGKRNVLQADYDRLEESYEQVLEGATSMAKLYTKDEKLIGELFDEIDDLRAQLMSHSGDVRDEADDAFESLISGVFHREGVDADDNKE